MTALALDWDRLTTVTVKGLTRDGLEGRQGLISDRTEHGHVGTVYYYALSTKVLFVLGNAVGIGAPRGVGMKGGVPDWRD